MIRAKIVRYRTLAIAAGIAAIAAGPAGPAEAAFLFKKIVDTDTLVPGGGGATFDLRGVPATSGEWVVFTAKGSDNQGYIWRARRNGTKLKQLIGPDNRIPGGWGKFKQLAGDRLQLYGDTLILVADNCFGCGVGIFTRSVFGGPITKLVDKNDTNPNFPTDNKHFREFGADFRVGEDLVVFNNDALIFSVPITGGAVTAIAGPQDEGFTPPGIYCCLFDNPSVRGNRVFLKGGNVFGRDALFTVSKSGSPGSFRVVATNAMHPPKTPAGYRFDDFAFWGMLSDEKLVFGGAGICCEPPVEQPPPPITGIYSRGGSFIRLVDTNMAVPGGTGNFVFAGHGTASPIVASNGIVVFLARDADNKVGIYAVRQTGGRVRKIIAEGDQLDSLTVAPNGLNMGRGALSGTTLVFSVQFTNFKEGMYSTQVVLP